MNCEKEQNRGILGSGRHFLTELEYNRMYLDILKENENDIEKTNEEYLRKRKLINKYESKSII